MLERYSIRSLEFCDFCKPLFKSLYRWLVTDYSSHIGSGRNFWINDHFPIPIAILYLFYWTYFVLKLIVLSCCYVWSLKFWVIFQTWKGSLMQIFSKLLIQILLCRHEILSSMQRFVLSESIICFSDEWLSPLGHSRDLACILCNI